MQHVTISQITEPRARFHNKL